MIPAEHTDNTGHRYGGHFAYGDVSEALTKPTGVRMEHSRSCLRNKFSLKCFIGLIGEN